MHGARVHMMLRRKTREQIAEVLPASDLSVAAVDDYEVARSRTELQVGHHLTPSRTR